MSCAASSEPPLLRNTVMPVPRNVWLQKASDNPAAVHRGFDYTQHIAPADSLAGKLMRLVERLEDGRLRVVDPGGRDIGVKIRFRFVMQPDQLLLISFFKESEPGAFSFQPVIGAR